MIKINLLPPNLFEGKVIRNIAIVFGVLAVAILAGFWFWNQSIAAETAKTKSDADTAQQLTEEAKRYDDQAASQRAGIAPIDQKVKFFDAVYKHNEAFIDLYGELARFTYKRVAYSQVSLTADGSMTLQANAPNMRDVGRYLLNMYGASHLFSSVVLSAAPTLSAAGNASGAMPGGAALPGSPMSVSPPSMMPGSASAMPPGNAPPTTATAGMGAISLSDTKATAAAKRRFTFNMSCVLTPDWKTRITAPVAPGMAAAAPGMGAVSGGAMPPANLAKPGG